MILKECNKSNKNKYHYRYKIRSDWDVYKHANYGTIDDLYSSLLKAIEDMKKREKEERFKDYCAHYAMDRCVK